MRPTSGVIPLALKGVQPVYVWNIASRNASDASNQKPGRDVIALICFDLPKVSILEELCRGDSGVELDIAAKVEAIHYMVEVG